MRAKLALATLTLVLGAWMPAEPRVATQIPDDQGAAWDPGLSCTGRVDIPLVQNVIEAKWSPNNTTLALEAGQRTPSTT